ncbi:MAG: hypothetical protein OXI43_12765 [Candidatus Poribacteria bacterium]|nr:hypothetical protein [Candidatus Poribacteria bacterium]
MVVNWIKPSNGKYYLLSIVDLNHEHFENLEGVYIIYSGASVIYVGRGEIAARLLAHRQDFYQRSDYKTLKVIWASRSEAIQGCGTLSCQHTYNPVVGKRHSGNVLPPEI